MKVFWTYFILELKKSIRILGKSILGILLMLGLLIAGVAAVSYTMLQSQVFQKVHVAVAIPKEEEQTRLALRLISAMESVESICEFHYMDKEAAWEGMEEGSLQAVIEIPENFFMDVYTGKNTPATVYFPREQDLGGRLFRELFTRGVSLLQTSEAGVYASLDMAERYQARMEAGEIGDYVARLYAEEVFRRDAVFDKAVTSPFGEVNLYQFYFSAALLLALMMGGLSYGFLYQRQGRAVEQKLRVYGLGSFRLSLARISVMAVILWLTGNLLYLAGCLLSAGLDWGFLSPDPGVVAGLFLLCAAIAAYFHAVYGTAGSSVQGAVLLFALNLVMVICSGILIPTAYLPELAGRIGRFFPLQLWNQYCLGLVFGSVSVMEILLMLGFIILGTGIGAVSLWKKA